MSVGHGTAIWLPCSSGREVGGTIARYADPGPSVGTMDKLTSDKRYLSNAWHLSGALRFIAVPSL